VSPLLVELARQATSEAMHHQPPEEGMRQMLSAYLTLATPKRTTPAQVQTAFFADLSPAQVVAIERVLASIRQTGRCVALTDLDEMLAAFSGDGATEGTLDVLADYLAAGGVLVFSTDTTFDWFYVRLLRPLIVQLGARSPLLSRVLLILSGGTEIVAFEDGAYRRIARGASRSRSEGFDMLVGLSKERRAQGMPVLDAAGTVYIGDSTAAGGIDRALAGRVGIAIDIGDAIPETPGRPVVGLHHSYRRTMDMIVSATGTLRDSWPTDVPPPSDVGGTVLWTFEQPHFPPGRRIRVRVGGSGFVHAGLARTNGSWSRVYTVPLMPRPEGGHEAVLPFGVNVFTFFWTEAPWTPGRPGHWERGPNGPRVFNARRD
jgi:hypothetical protein